jgi:hypothetical protein
MNSLRRYRPAVRRFHEVEADVLTEAVALLFIGGIIVAAATVRITHEARLIVYVVFMFVLVIAVWRRWAERRKRWERFVQWERWPVAVEGPIVSQNSEDGERTGSIDTRGHYTVRWERFSSDRVLYLIRRGASEIFVSTLASNGLFIVKNVLRIDNYPCEEWPKPDL